MKRIISVGIALLVIFAFAGCSSQNENEGENKDLVSLNWEYEPVEYDNFTDLGNYMLELKGVSVKDLDEGLVNHAKTADSYSSANCSGTIKKNDKGEVLMSHSMDVEISQSPGFITRISDGKYDAVMISYAGGATPYKYTPEDLKKMDKDTDYLSTVPVKATDVMNETGLYIALDMRCGDAEGGMDCPGTNPGKPRAAAISAPVLVGLNCSTVREAIDFLNDSYDWYTLSFSYPDGTTNSWNMAFLIGDATGEYGLVEFGRNGVYFTPYQNYQSNYYIHPLLAERAVINAGYGRAEKLLDGLMDVQTEKEIYENQKKARFRYLMEKPSWENYSEAESLENINARRELSEKEQAEIFEDEVIYSHGIKDNMEKLEAYYKGDEKGLRDDAIIWLGTITTGVNCATKHAIIEMWENNTMLDIQW